VLITGTHSSFPPFVLYNHFFTNPKIFFFIRWTDTDKDPYSAHRGFFFSHFGWMMVQRPKNRIGYADVADLKADPVVSFQHKYYPYFALGMGFIFPTLVAGLGWGDFRVSLNSELALLSILFKKLIMNLSILGWLFLCWCSSSCVCSSCYFLCQQFSSLFG
jgi:hypothetical protein